MRREQNGAARRVIHAARLHADEAILDQIESSDGVPLAITVQCFQQRCGAHRLAIDRNRITLFKVNGDDLSLIGSRFQMVSARSEEHTSELQSLMRISYAVFCLKKKIKPNTKHHYRT